MESPVLTSAQMRGAEKAAFARGVEVEALMDQAGAGVARAVTKFLPHPGTCIVFAGKGNNAGDALVAAQHLRRGGWRIEIRLAFPENDCSELMRKKLDALRAMATATTPEWTDHMSHDPGVTILELSAYSAESLMPSQDGVALAWGRRETAAARAGARSLSPNQSTKAEKERLCFRG